MKVLLFLVLAATAAALPNTAPLRLVEYAPGKSEWVSESKKWELLQGDVQFMDITEAQDLDSVLGNTMSSKKGPFPPDVAFQDKVNRLLPSLNKDNMKENLEAFSSFHDRYYKSSYGKQSSEWLLKNVQATLAASRASSASAAPFKHTSWTQDSVIATIPGRSNRTIVIGAHQDSINQFSRTGVAPGVDDDGSGTVTIWEAMRVLLTDPSIAGGQAENTIEFHWYAAEEVGLLGSQAIFKQYASSRRDVRAMLQQDMTGYIQGMLDAGMPESVGIITDYVDKDLSEFMKRVIDAYCDIPYVLTKCGYGCSDHASATKAGYPSAFVFESDFDSANPNIHSPDDTMEFVNFDHMIEHAKLTVGMAYELAFAKFE